MTDEDDGGARHGSGSAPGASTDDGPPRRQRRRTRRRGRATVVPDALAPSTVPTQVTPAAADDSPAPKRPRRRRKPKPRVAARPKAANSRALYAALDLGTNNCRLLVAAAPPSGTRPRDLTVVDSFSRIVRLGEGLGATGLLSQDAMDRAVEALKVCAAKLRNRAPAASRLIATEACRRADNGEAFLERIRTETGLDLEIVDRETEARLSVAGCGTLVDRRTKGAVLFDIGGGSSELSLLKIGPLPREGRSGGGKRRRRRKNGPRGHSIAAWTSLPLGVVTLSEKHGGGRAVTRDIFEAMVDEVTGLLAEFEGRDALAEAVAGGDLHLLGTSGTVTTLAGVHLKLPRYDRRKVDGIWMRTHEIDTVIEDLLAMSYEERMGNPCIGRDRADLVLAGCAILVAIRRQWPCERLRVADRGLREGILSELMQADGAFNAARNPTPSSEKNSNGR